MCFEGVEFDLPDSDSIVFKMKSLRAYFKISVLYCMALILLYEMRPSFRLIVCEWERG